MNSSEVNASQSSNPTFFERHRESINYLLVITAVALGIIGALAAYDVGELSALAPHWYYFEIGAVVCLVVRSLSCFSKDPDVMPPSQGVKQPTPEVVASQPVEKVKETPKELTAEELYRQAKGLEDKKEWEKAFQLYFDTAQKHSHLPSVFKVAQFQEEGTGVAKSLNDARNNYKIAADRGFLPAVYKMALFECQPLRTDEVVAWVRKAQENGCDKAKGFLETIEKAQSNPALQQRLTSSDFVENRVKLLLAHHKATAALHH